MVSNGIHNLSNLVGSARSGNKMSLEELASLFHQKVFQFVYYRTGSRMDAEDLTQEIFMEMSRSLGRLKDPGSFRAWLYRIALNRVRDFHRKKKVMTFLTGTEALEDTEASGNEQNGLDHMMKKEFWQQFHGVTRKMSRKEREVFILRYVDQLGLKEIAETLRNSESTVKTHLYRALKKFKKASEFRTFLKGDVL